MSNTAQITETIFAFNNQIIDIKELESKNIDTIYSKIYLMGVELTGSTETESNPLFFGEVDSDGVFVESSPIYYLTSEDTSNSTLKVFLGSSNLTILHYSLLDSSLNIKLESKSKESKEILEKEKALKAKQESNQQDSASQSSAMLCPILEDDNLKCSHGGIVKLESNLGKAFKSKGKSMILESDLLNSKIQGCPNPPTSGGPCNLVSVILPSARALKKYNDDYPIMQDLVSSGVLSDKGLPLTCTPKANTFKINSPAPTNAENITKEGLESQLDTAISTLSIVTEFRDLQEFYFTPSTYETRESASAKPKAGIYKTYSMLEVELENIKDDGIQDLNKNTFLQAVINPLTQIYSPKSFSYRMLSIRVAYCIFEYILIIPKSMPKFVLKILKKSRKSDEIEYGYGRFMDLKRDYIRNMDNSNTNLPTLLNIQGKVLFAPTGASRIRIEVR